MGSGKGIPEYTQRQLNNLFARYILYGGIDASTPTEDYEVLRMVEDDWYILKGEEE